MYNFIGDNLDVPITNMFDINGNETSDPSEAFTIVALLPTNEWLSCECQSYEIVKRVVN